MQAVDTVDSEIADGAAGCGEASKLATVLPLMTRWSGPTADAPTTEPDRPPAPPQEELADPPARVKGRRQKIEVPREPWHRVLAGMVERRGPIEALTKARDLAIRGRLGPLSLADVDTWFARWLEEHRPR